MKKGLLAAFLVLVLGSANALAEWQEVNTSDDKANTPEQVLDLLASDAIRTQFLRNEATNRQLAGLKVKVIKKLELSTTSYKWVGETSCPAGDSRLQYSASSVSICYRGDSTCMAWSPSMPSDDDPCAK